MDKLTGQNRKTTSVRFFFSLNLLHKFVVMIGTIPLKITIKSVVLKEYDLFCNSKHCIGRNIGISLPIF